MACYFINGNIMLVNCYLFTPEIVGVYIKKIKYYTLGSNYELNLNLCIGQINTLKEGMSILNDTLFSISEKRALSYFTRAI